MTVKINDTDCRMYGLSLQDCRISAPVRKHHWVSIPGGDGQLDLLEGTGPPRYEPRTVSLLFTPAGQKSLTQIRQLLNALEGRRVDLQLPGYEDYTISGSFHLSGADQEIACTVLCNPWFICRWDAKFSVSGTAAGKDIRLQNHGTREAVPEFEVMTEVRIESGKSSVSLSPGKHLLPDFVIDGGKARIITVYDGSVIIRFREAIL